MAVPKSKKTTEAHHCIRNAAGKFINNEMIDFADIGSVWTVDLRALNVLA
jgi:hypothetical protein